MKNMDGYELLNLKKFGFTKTEKDLAIGWYDYILEEINPEYDYFFHAALCYPRKPWAESDNICHRMVRIYVYRGEFSNWSIEQGDCEIVFNGLIANQDELLVLLKMLAIIPIEDGE